MGLEVWSSEVGESMSITTGFGAASPSSCSRHTGYGACQTSVCRDRSRRGHVDDESCCWQCSWSRERSRCCRSPISQPLPCGREAALASCVPAARQAVHLGEGCCGGRRSSSTRADRAKLLAGGCLEGGCSIAASINLWGASASAAQA